MTRPVRLAVSVGCPCGIGPEVSVVAAVGAEARVLLVGDEATLRSAAASRRVSKLVRVEQPDEAWRLGRGRVGVWEPTAPLAARDRRPGEPTSASGRAQLAWIDAASDLCARGEADAMVTGPVSKDAIARSGARGAAGFIGHTEHLQRRLDAKEVVMAFWSRELTTSLVTTHVPLASVSRAVDRASVGRSAFWLAWLLATLGGRAPRVVVASLNPHAGEGGLFGLEEKRAIVPGIALARTRLARAGLARVTLAGPIGAESAFRLAVAGRFDGVVAMYHDQATIPMKLLGFGEAVNVSLGLPIVRTSVDHGTAYDLAGRGKADASGMREAMQLAAKLASRTATTASRRRGRPPSRAG